MAAMRAIPPQRLITPEEFMRMSEFNERYELIGGKVVAKPMPVYEGADLSFEFLFAYRDFDPASKLGRMRAEVRMRVKRTGEFFIPDLSFWVASRIPSRSEPTPAAPDLAIEIQSPDQSLATLAAKVPDYLDSGVRLVWIVQPNKRIAAVFRPGRSGPETIQPTGLLDGTKAGATGFTIKLTDLFREK